MNYCRHCGAAVAKRDRFCTHCGHALEAVGPRPDRQKSLTMHYRIGAGIILAAALVAVIIFVLSNPGETGRQLRLGQAYLLEGNHEAAIPAFEKVIALDPSNVEARVGLGKAYAAANRLDQAETVLLEAVALDPGRPEPYLELAGLYVLRNLPEEAHAILKAGLEATGQADIEAMVDEVEELLAENQSLALSDILSFLGATLSEIESLLGEPEGMERFDYSGIFYETYYLSGELVLISGEIGNNAKVTSIRVHREDIPLLNGVKIGDPASRVEELLGEPFSESFDYHLYNAWNKIYLYEDYILYFYFDERDGRLQYLWIKDNPL